MAVGVPVTVAELLGRRRYRARCFQPSAWLQQGVEDLDIMDASKQGAAALLTRLSDLVSHGRVGTGREQSF